MSFEELLNRYISQIGCTAKELAARTEISEVRLSRFRNGERKPTPEQIDLLAEGISALSKNMDTKTVRNELTAALTENAVNYERVIGNFHVLTANLNIRLSELAKALSFDASYLSRIRAGQRKPADIASFVDGVCHFIVRKYTSDSDIAAVASMIGSESERLKDEKVYFHTLTEWMYDGELKVSNTAESFLKKLDEFDLSEYIRIIHFDEIKIPTAPFQMPARHSATGLKDMMATELNFLKATVLSRSDSSVLIYSDMPMEQMAKTAEFPKKWMYGMAAMLKKGLHLNMIHNVDRPLQEMMLGLESYIPMYMTGQISPYYLDAPPSKVFHHLLEVSGAAALEGSAIVGHHAEGKYYLTNNKEEVRQYQKRANALLSKAKPLMDIYRADSEQAFRKFWEEDFQNKVKPRHMIFSSLPLFTISDQLLERIISHNHVTSHDKERIVKYVHF